MAGYTKNRESNYEMKYLRKVMGQVDKRIQVPENISADSLRHLLDSVEVPSVREVTPRRPFRLSLQSGIAYAAAFALIVALFYATRLYRPDIITGGMDISTASQQPAPAAPNSAEDTGAAIDGDEAQAPFADAETADAPIATFSLDNPEANDAQEDVETEQPRSHVLAVGGSGKATLVLAQDGYAFYWRENDLSDPDRTSPVSFEVVDTVTQEAVTQTDVPLLAVSRSFESGGRIILVGSDLAGGTAICSYDVSAADGTFVEAFFAQDGELVDSNIYKDIIRIITISETGESGQDSELLPGAVSGEACVITAFDPVTHDVVTKRFVGANGTVQLHNLNAYIRYAGQDDSGEAKDYVAQILFDGMGIELGTVS